MTRGVVIALGVAAAILGVIVISMTRQSAPGLRGGVPYYTPGAPNQIGGPPLPAAGKLSSFLQQVTGTAKAASGTVDALGELWNKTGKQWSSGGDSLGDMTAEDIDNLILE